MTNKTYCRAQGTPLSDLQWPVREEKLQSSGVIGFLKWPIDQHERGTGEVRQEVGGPGRSSVGHLGGLALHQDGREG